MAGRVEYTIDELAREAGTTVRSLRVYHERGVLPPPRVKGRTGFYGAEHLNRVRTISRLLDRGIKLNGIKELLAAWDRGDDLGDVLGVSESSAEPAASAATEDIIAATELAERYSAVPNGLARVVAAGLYEPVDASTYRPADRTLIRVLEQMEAAGIPVDDMLAELEKLRTDADRVARRFVELFHRTVWQEYQRSERSAADRAELTESLDVAKVVPGQVTGELVNRFVARYFDEDTELAEL
ncbi:MerR family transcriptional regulator [Nocardia cyriacigeorgica]|uniref:MerR family transcriptional regulator n=1 Tax=Nocardia cyriacigeorgica TaxID=135487 RepID=UPI00158B125E|nr:MerR family transcriptional regulator [Nocardia cyriacigeorgica]MBF6439869.1 MerR family transcriptional regulator [Nocardia cyriacigeorgica]